MWADLRNGRGRARKSLTILGFDPRTVQHVESPCNDYAILGVHILDERAIFFIMLLVTSLTSYDIYCSYGALCLSVVVCLFISAMFVTRMTDERMWRHWIQTVEILGEETVRPILRLQLATRLPWKRVQNSVISNRRITAWEEPDSPLSPDIPLRTYHLLLEHDQQSNYPCLTSALHKRHTVAHVAFIQLCLRAIMCKSRDEVELKSK